MSGYPPPWFKSQYEADPAELQRREAEHDAAERQEAAEQAAAYMEMVSQQLVRAQAPVSVLAAHGAAIQALHEWMGEAE